MSRSLLTRSRALNGFTLVEVLVVLVVVCLLAAVLLPAFNRARETAQTAHCANNLLQIQFALQLYRQDAEGYYPYFLGQGANCNWLDRIEGYVKSPAVFECPEADNGEYRTGCIAPPGPGVQYGGSYSINASNRDPRFRLRASTLQHPDRIIMVVDGTGYNGLVDFTNDPQPGPAAVTSGGVAARHRDGANALFGDGHIKWLRLTAMADRHVWFDADTPVPTPPPAP